MSAVFGMLMLTGTIAAAEPTATLYQLQKRCERLAVEAFNRETADDEDRVDYRATYISPTPGGVNTWVYLSDLQENRIYGGFHKSTNIGLFYCSLQNKESHSEVEWNDLLKPYMED
jgi:hypothetical protein